MQHHPSASDHTAASIPTTRQAPRFKTWSLAFLLLAVVFALLPRLATRGISTTALRPVSTANSATMPQKLNSLEDRQWNSLADRMDMFHNHFRYEFDRVYKVSRARGRGRSCAFLTAAVRGYDSAAIHP